MEKRECSFLSLDRFWSKQKSKPDIRSLLPTEKSLHIFMNGLSCDVTGAPLVRVWLAQWSPSISRGKFLNPLILGSPICKYFSLSNGYLCTVWNNRIGWKYPHRKINVGYRIIIYGGIFQKWIIPHMGLLKFHNTFASKIPSNLCSRPKLALKMFELVWKTIH